MDDAPENTSELVTQKDCIATKVIAGDESVTKMLQHESDTCMESDQEELNKSPESDSMPSSSSAQISSKGDSDSGFFSKTQDMEMHMDDTNGTDSTTPAVEKNNKTTKAMKNSFNGNDTNDGTTGDDEIILDWPGVGFDVACNVTVEKNDGDNAGPGSSGGDGDSVEANKSLIIKRHKRNRARNYRNTSTMDDTSEPETENVPSTASQAAATQSTEQNENVANVVDSPSTSAAVESEVDGDLSADVPMNSNSDRENTNESYAAQAPSPRLLVDDSSDTSLNSDDDDDDGNGDDDEVLLDLDVDDEDDEDRAYSSNVSHDTEPTDQSELKELLNKSKPTYTWNAVYELMWREHGLTYNRERSLKNGLSLGFNSRFHASRHVIELMALSHKLNRHHGCVNCLNFNRTGELLCTGSDDTRIKVWNWAQGKAVHDFKSGHTENIFQTKFIDSGGCLDIVSASRDGQVRRSMILSSGGKVKSSCLYKHHESVHKLVICPQSVYEIISVGEDGYIRHKDIRTNGKANEMLKVVTGSKNRKLRLFSISHHPFAPEICVCGCDSMVRVYDKRNMAKAVHEMCPEHLAETSTPQVTCSVYSNTGKEILSSYSDDHIYLFNNQSYKTGEFLHRYKGHYNHRTIKGVNFFGPNSEYIVSGSDCGNIFFWDRNTEAIVNFMHKGDVSGVVNCLEPHPSIPVLATSGLDHDIKIWAPCGKNYPPEMSHLKNYVERNLRRCVIEDSSAFDDRQFQYFIRQFLRRPPSEYARSEYSDHDDDSSSNAIDTQMSSSSSSSSSSSTIDDDYIRCHPQ